MNRKIVGQIVLFLLFAWGQVLGQDDPPVLKTKANWRLSFDYGVGLSFGSVWQGFRETQTLSEHPDYEFDFSLRPARIFRVGTKYGKNLSSKLQVGTGLQLGTRGYTLKMKTWFRDPEYQYDELTIDAVRLRIWAMEIPLWGAFELGKGWGLEMGAVPALNLPWTARSIFKRRTKIYVNGERDRLLSREKIRERHRVPDRFNLVSLGGYLLLQKELDQNWDMVLEGRYGGVLFPMNEGKVSDWQITLGFQLHL